MANGRREHRRVESEKQVQCPLHVGRVKTRNSATPGMKWILVYKEIVSPASAGQWLQTVASGRSEFKCSLHHLLEIGSWATYVTP